MLGWDVDGGNKGFDKDAWVNRLWDEDEWTMSRPRIPALLWLALSFWLGTAAFFTGMFWASSSLVVAMLAAGIGFSLALGVAAFFATRFRAVMLVLLGVALASVCASAAALPLKGVDMEGLASCEYFALTSDTRKSQRGFYAVAQALLPDGGKVKVRLHFPEEAALISGRIVKGTGTVAEISEDQAQRAWNDGIVANVYLDGFQVIEGRGIGARLRDFRQKAIDALAGDGESSLFLQAILVGYRPQLYESDLYDAVKADGLAHLVAVSGAHLVIVVSLAGTLLFSLRVRKSYLLAVQCIMLAAYLVVTAFPVSACRAAVMSLIALGSSFANRRSLSLQALSLCVLVMVATDPMCAASYSFVLSAGSVLGIALFQQFFTQWTAKLVPAFPDGINQLVALTLSSNVVTIPLSAAWFSQVSLISVLSNVVAAPLFTFFCAGGLLVVVADVATGGMSHFLTQAVLMLAQVFCDFLQLLACVPMASIATSVPFALALLAVIALVAGLWWFWPRPSAKAGWAVVVIAAALFCAFYFVAPNFAGAQIIMLDVGQGDAIVIRDGARAVLVDTGTNDGQLLEGLARHGIRRLDAVVITHPDDDHCGSLEALGKSVPVSRVLVAADLLQDEGENSQKLRQAAERLVGKGNLVGLHVGDGFSLGAVRGTVVWPDAFSCEGGNGDSLVLRVSWDCDADGTSDGVALLCGDAESEVLQACLQKGRIGQVDIYKVGHHGSLASINHELALRLKPQVALVSVGAHNRYGHPTADALDALAQAGSAIYRTDTMGDVVCQLSAIAVSVTKSKFYNV